MRIGIVAGATGWHVQDLLRAGGRLGLALEVMDFARLASRLGGGPRFENAGTDLAALDRLLVRSMPRGSLEQVIYRMDVLQRLEARGVPVINNPRSLEAAIDKYLSTARLEAAGLPVPATAACESAADALRAWEELGGDAVVKPLFGSEGRGVERIASRSAAEAHFAALEAAGSVIYLQRFIPHAGRDVRVLTLGGEPAWWMGRAAAGGFVTNIARGGRPERMEISAEMKSLAARAAECIGAEIAGVDILPDRAGNLWLLEVNAVPGWRALSETCGADVAAAILAYVMRAKERRRDGGR